jgi:hypothetical protein
MKDDIIQRDMVFPSRKSDPDLNLYYGTPDWGLAFRSMLMIIDDQVLEVLQHG